MAREASTHLTPTLDTTCTHTMDLPWGVPQDFKLGDAVGDQPYTDFWEPLTKEVAARLPRNSLLCLAASAHQFHDCLCRYSGPNAAKVLDVTFGGKTRKKMKAENFLCLKRANPIAREKAGKTVYDFEKADRHIIGKKHQITRVPPLLGKKTKAKEGDSYHRKGNPCDHVRESIEAFKYTDVAEDDHYETPANVWRFIEKTFGRTRDQWFDPYPPAALNPRNADGTMQDALKIEWKSHNYVNPPFRAKPIALAIEKAYKESLKGRFTLMLVPARFERRWFQEAIRNKMVDQTRFVYYDNSEGPVKFIHQSSGAPMNSQYGSFLFWRFDPINVVQTPEVVSSARIVSYQEKAGDPLARAVSREEFDSQLHEELDVVVDDEDELYQYVELLNYEREKRGQEPLAIANMAEAKLAMKELDSSAPCPEPEPELAEPEPEQPKIDPNGAFEIVNGKWQPIAGSTYRWQDLNNRLMAERAALKPPLPVPPLNGWEGWHIKREAHFLTLSRAEPTTPKEKRTVQLGDCLVCQSNNVKKKNRRGIVTSVGTSEATCKIIDATSGAVLEHFGKFKHSNKKTAVFDDIAKTVYNSFADPVTTKMVELAAVKQEAVIKQLDVQLAAAEPEPNREYLFDCFVCY